MLVLDKWRQILLGARQEFEILTDHQNLQYFKKPQKLNRQQARWIIELAQYDFLLRHQPGALNKQADLLSCHADHNQGKEDNQDVVLLKPEYFRAQELVLEGVEKELLDQIRSECRIDGSIRAALDKKLPSWKK
jgi:hypothetical protein